MSAVLQLGTYLLSLQSNSPFLSTPHFQRAIWMQTHDSLTGLVIITLKLADNYCAAARCGSQSKRAELPSPGSCDISRAASNRQMHH